MIVSGSPGPLIVDLFSGAGGAGEGYYRAGFRVVGVDINPQPNYPFTFVQDDALKVLRSLLDGGKVGGYHLRDIFAFHASPPCQRYSLIAAGGVRRKPGHPDTVEDVRKLFLASGLPYVIENVPQAPLINPVTLCGTSFGLPIIRHRSFECSFPVPENNCGYKPTARVPHKNCLTYPYGRKSWRPAWEKHVIPVIWPWMTINEAGQAIPPDYTDYLGQSLRLYLEAAAAA